MQIIQMADLHITEDSDIFAYKARITKLHDAIRGSLSTDECTVFCILGDIVDKGNAALYNKAVELLQYLQELFAEYSPKFEFTAGNHDLCGCPYAHPTPAICPEEKCSINHFSEFAKKFDEKYDPTKSIRHCGYDDIDLVIASSVYRKTCKYGFIDIEELEKINIDKPAFLITHHTILSENDDDNAAIRNAYKLLDIIEEKNFVGILHGHTHGYKDILIGSKCKVVGVGPFLKDIPNVNNQINLVIANSSGIHSITNFFYRKDINLYESKNIFTKKNFCYSATTDIRETYQSIVLDTQKHGVLPNMMLNLSMDYNLFISEIERTFPEQIPTAELWQETKNVPESLYYNHGQYMRDGEISALDFVVKELKSKATSSRAIIPLISFKDVMASGDGFLPSFDLVQFGFLTEKKDSLLVTLYLRALEVNHFLKINLCEIYLMCKKIAEEIRSIETLDITIIAFRAQYKENFGCFRRAKIDTVSESDIAYSLQDNLAEVVEWLLEKKNFNETVVENSGMKNLFSALDAKNKRKAIKPKILLTADAILKTIEQLKSERKKTSNYSFIEMVENKMREHLDEMIALLQEGEIYESGSDN